MKHTQLKTLSNNHPVVETKQYFGKDTFTPNGGVEITDGFVDRKTFSRFKASSDYGYFLRLEVEQITETIRSQVRCRSNSIEITKDHAILLLKNLTEIVNSMK